MFHVLVLPSFTFGQLLRLALLLNANDNIGRSEEEVRGRVLVLCAKAALKVNGALVNGAFVNDAFVNGALVNGALVNGALVNGALVNGALVNGAFCICGIGAMGLQASNHRRRTTWHVKTCVNDWYACASRRAGTCVSRWPCSRSLVVCRASGCGV